MMRNMLTLFVGLLLVSPGYAQAPAGSEDTAVREVVKKYMDARERRDEQALRALFTEDVDQLVSTGEWRRGREALVGGTMAASVQAGDARTVTIQNVRFPAPDVAIADGPYEVNAQNTAAARRMWSSFVMVRTAGVWRIAAIRNMLPAP